MTSTSTLQIDLEELLGYALDAAAQGEPLAAEEIGQIRAQLPQHSGLQLSTEEQFELLEEILLSPKPSAALITLDDLGLLESILPELSRARGVMQNRFHKYDVFYHSVYSCDAMRKDDFVLRLAALLHDLGKVETRRVKSNGEATFHNHEMVGARLAARICQRLGMSGEEGKKVRFLVRNHMFHYTGEWSDRAVRRFTQRVPADLLEDLIELRLADRAGSGKRHSLPKAIHDLIEHIEEIRRQEAELKIRDLEIGGHDLIDMGLRPGPAMGEILRDLLERVRSEELPNQRERLLAEVEPRVAAEIAAAESKAEKKREN